MAKLWNLERKPRLLIVEDDLDIANMLKIYLGREEADVTVSMSGSDGLALYSTQLFDLVLLDIMLPDIDGFAVMRAIQVSGDKVPVFFLTQKDERSDKLYGLELGADDYIARPFDIEELKLRIKIGLRHRLDYLKYAAQNTEGKFSGHVFISYSHKDSEYTHRLATEIEKHSIPVWIDDRIDYGTRWPHVIQEKIDSCKAFILVMSDNARKSEWVSNELTYAQSKGKKIYPLLLKGDVWLSVASIQYANVRNRRLPKDSFFKNLMEVLS